MALTLKMISGESLALASQSPAFFGDLSSRKVILLGGVIILTWGAGYYLGSRGKTSLPKGEDSSAPETPSFSQGVINSPAPGDIIPPYPGMDGAGLREYLAQRNAFEGLGLERVALRREHFQPFVTDFLAAPPPSPSNLDAGRRVLETGVSFGRQQDLFLGVSRQPSGEVRLQALCQGFNDAGRPQGYTPLTPSRTLGEALDMLQNMPPAAHIVGFTTLAALLAGALAGQVLADVRAMERARRLNEQRRASWNAAQASGRAGDRPAPLDISS